MHEKMLSIISHQGNANQNHNEISPHTCQNAAAAVAAKSLQSCPTLCDPIDGSPPGSPVPGILQARTLGVGCHFLLQCRKVKSEREVAQSCPTLSDPMDCLFHMSEWLSSKRQQITSLTKMWRKCKFSLN